MPQKQSVRHFLPGLTAAATLLAFPAEQLAAAKDAAPAPTHSREIVAYIRNGDLYTQELPDGAPNRLTQDGHSGRPVWSPSGRWVAVWQHPTEKGDKDFLRVVRRDGRLTRDFHDLDWRNFDFASKGEQIAIVSKGGKSVYLADLAGGKTHTVFAFTPKSHTVCNEAVWSSDGRWLACTQYRQTGKIDASHDGDVTLSLWVVHPDGTGARRLYSAGHEGGPSQPRWSPDSRYLFFHALNYYPAGSVNADGTPLYACRADGSAPAFPVFGKSRDDDDHFVLRASDFLAFRQRDGRLAAVVGSDRQVITNKRIYLLDPPYRASNRSVSSPVTPADLAAIDPVWSPDGSRIAFHAAPNLDRPDEEHLPESSLKETHLWVMDADGKNARRLDSGRCDAGGAAAWLRDNHSLLYEKNDPKGHNSLWIIDADRDTNPRCMVTEVGPRAGNASWWAEEAQQFAVLSPPAKANGK